MKTTHLFLRHGGEVLSIEAVGHSTYKKVAEWFYICTVKWPDNGKVTDELTVSPAGLCHDGTPEGEALRRDMADRLDRYLKRAGRWHEPKDVGEYTVHWTPKKERGRATIESLAEKEAA